MKQISIGFCAVAVATSLGHAPTALAQHEKHAMDMKSLADTMPRLQPTRVYTVTGTENWDAKTRFGLDAPMVEMMNQMMVGGSGMEGMKMAPMKTGAEMNGKPMMGEMAGMDHGMPDTPTGGTQNPAGPRVEAALNTNPPIVGDNSLEFTVKDAAGKPLTGLKLNASVGMTSMDMGTTRPEVKEIGDGRYTVAPQFSMIGPWRVTITGGGVNIAFDFNAGSLQKWTQAGPSPGPSGEQAIPTTPEAPNVNPSGPPTTPTAAPPEPTNPAMPGMTMPPTDEKGAATPAATTIKITVTLTKPKAGDNAVDILVTDAAGKPVTGAKVKMSVAMTSMDMGTSHPAVRETGHGHYTSTATFSMQGPWRVSVTATPPRGKPVTRSFDFSVQH